MNDKNKSKTQLMAELTQLRQQLATIEGVNQLPGMSSLTEKEECWPHDIEDQLESHKAAQEDIEELHQTEAVLGVDEAWFRRVVSSISHHVYMTEIKSDGQQVNHYISPNVAELTGYPVEKFVTDWRFWRSLIHADDKNVANNQVGRFSKGKNSETEYRLVKADGDIIWVRDSVQVEEDAVQDKIIVYGVVSDITDRKMAEVLLTNYNRELQENVAERTRKVEKKNAQLEQEISERKLIEQALGESEASLRELFKQAQTALALTEDQARRLGYMNEMSQQINLAVSEEIVFKVAASFTPKIIQSDYTSVTLLTPTGHDLDVFTLESDVGAVPQGITLPLAGTMVGQVVQDKQMLLISESENSNLFDVQNLFEQGLHSCLSTPLVIGGQIIGTLNTAAASPKAYGQRDKHLVQQIASLLASNIENRRLFLKMHIALTETEAYADRLKLLNEVSQDINLAVDEMEIFKIATRHTTEIIEADWVSITLLREHGVYFETFTFYDERADISIGKQLPVQGTLIGEVMRQKQMMNISDLHLRNLLDTTSLFRAGVVSFLVAPMMIGERVIGTLNLASRNSGVYGTRDEGLLLQFASFLGVTVEKTRRNKELQQAKESAERAKQAAEEANRAKTEFLANMSHELRTPLNGILGYTQILYKEKNLTDKHRAGLNIIHRSGEHLLTLINDILDLSKIEARKMELLLTDFHLSNMLQNLADIFYVRAEQKGISFDYELFSDLPLGLHGDEQKLRQILVNLLGNALKFTVKGGVAFKVGILDDNALAQDIQNISTPKTYRIRFQVEDTGIGINPDALEEIFRPFQQVEQHNHTVAGTGLGLTISRRLTEKMGGKLNVKSEYGQGSTFWFELTFPEVQGLVESSKSDQRTVIGFKGRRRRVLVVDDKWANRSVLVNMLTPLGFEMQEAVNGQEAIAKTVEFEPDVILLDLRMPNMDGFEALRNIRTLPSGQDIVIVTVTASAFDHDRQQSLNAGSDDFIAKPFNLEKLLDILQKHLDIEWIYEENKPSENIKDSQLQAKAYAKVLSGQQADIVVPPKANLETLVDLGRRGDIDGILDQADQLESIDEQYALFANYLRQLAKGFKIKELQEFVIKYLDQN